MDEEAARNAAKLDAQQDKQERAQRKRPLQERLVGQLRQDARDTAQALRAAGVELRHKNAFWALTRNTPALPRIPDKDRNYIRATSTFIHGLGLRPDGKIVKYTHASHKGQPPKIEPARDGDIFPHSAIGEDGTTYNTERLIQLQAKMAALVVTEGRDRTVVEMI